jgi:hypothetical protein
MIKIEQKLNSCSHIYFTEQLTPCLRNNRLKMIKTRKPQNFQSDSLKIGLISSCKHAHQIRNHSKKNESNLTERQWMRTGRGTGNRLRCADQKTEGALSAPAAEIKVGKRARQQQKQQLRRMESMTERAERGSPRGKNQTETWARLPQWINTATKKKLAH